MPRARAKPTSTPPPVRTIAQADLSRVRELQDQARGVEHALAPLKRSILADLEAGLAVEAGPLQAEVEIRLQQRFSRACLTRILGFDRFDEVLSQIEPTESRSLKVTLWV